VTTRTHRTMRLGRSSVFALLLALGLAVIAASAVSAHAANTTTRGEQSTARKSTCAATGSRSTAAARQTVGGPGETASPISPVSVTPLPGGGFAYNYAVDGTTATFLVPPANFNPLEASDAQLAEYGFQPRPSTDSPGYASWLTTMSSYKTTPIPDIMLRSGPVTTPAAQSPKTGGGSAGTFATSIWGGWLADSSSQTYVATEMDLTEPSVTNICTGYNGAAQWTGLGGWNSTQLVQDGVEVPTSALSLCSSKSSGYCAWYEYLNGSTNHGPTLMGNVTVNAGDTIHEYTAYETSNGVINFYIADNTTGTSQSVVVSGVGTSYYDGSSGDFIGAEVPSVSGLNVGLKHFSTFSTSNSYAENTGGSWTSISAAQYPTETTLVLNGDTLATTGGLNGSGTGFSMTWDRCR
jgi:hypothetical protein